MRATLLGLMVTALATAGPIMGQTPTDASVPGTLVSIAGGIGGGTPAIDGQLSVSVARSAGDLIVRLAGGSEYELFQFSESTRDIAVLYGKRRRSDRGWLRAAAGIGHVRHDVRGDVVDCVLFFCTYERSTSTAMGLALHLDGVWAPRRGFGLGLAGLGNLNRQRSFGALTLTLHVGLVR